MQHYSFENTWLQSAGSINIYPHMKEITKREKHLDIEELQTRELNLEDAIYVPKPSCHRSYTISNLTPNSQFDT